jgi:protein-arginine kinase activator protein McsA
MECQECGREATVHVTDIAQGKLLARHLCDCHAGEALGGEWAADESLELTEADIEKWVFT